MNIKATLKTFAHIPDDISENELFRKMLVGSMVLHVSLIIFLLLKALIIPSSPIDLDANSINVDMVALPDKMPKLSPKEMAVLKDKPVVKKAVKEKPAPKPKPKPKKDTVNLSKRKKSAIERMKEQIKKEEQQKQRAENSDAQRRAKAIAELTKGNKITKSSSLGKLDRMALNSYQGELGQHIRQFWNLPQWLKEQNLRAIALIHLDYRGVVVSRKLIKKSTNPSFDTYVLKAIDEASPFPAPTEKFVDLVRGEGIKLAFPQR